MKAIVNNSCCQIFAREKLTRGTVGKTMEAEFSADWDGLAITAVFEAGDVKKDVVYTEEPIIIPHEVLATAGVSVMLGFNGALTDGTIVKRTEKEWINNVSETLDPAGIPSSEPTPDWTAQVQAIATEAKEVADSVRSDADAGKFTGPAGTDGGWYTPAITQPDANTMRVSFTPSKEGMPAVDPADIAIPTGGGSGTSGEDGGYYTPEVTQTSENTMQVAFTPSKTSMPAVSGKEITLPAGQKGDKGDAGAAGADGKSAYAYAVEGGYTGTEEEFAAKLAEETITIRTFKTQAIGELFDQPENYTAWCSGSLRYDDKLGKFVDLLYAAPKHENPDYTVNYVTYIDPKTYEATTPVLCKYYDTDGITELTISYAGRPAFVILRDGSYMILQTIGSSNYRFISTDFGLTWVKGEQITGYSGSTETYALVQLSNGRLLANAISNVINYSDDDGATWTSVTPVTSGASYEAEYCFLEVKSGVVLGICRKTVGGVGRTESGDAEHAVITVSRDYGTTWDDLKISETIDNMNASTCTGFVHDGIVEIFAASRWYHSGNYAVTDYLNTGKSGAITHYVATIDNALNDKFTKMGVIAYAKTTGETSPLAAQDFHTPCIAVNGNDMLMVYFDRVHPYDVVDMTNHYYIRGSLDGIDYGVNDDIQSKIFPVSSVKIDALLRKLKNELIVKINEAIISGGIIPPSEDENGNPGTYIMDGVLVNFNFTDSAAINTNDMTVTDSIHRVAASCTSEIFPEIRENSLAKATFNIPALGDYYGSTSLGKGFTIEISVYHYDGDTFQEWEFWRTPTNQSNYSAPGKYTRGTTLKYVDTDGAIQKLSYWAEWFGRGTTALGFYHIVITAGIDGIVNLYKNGECITTLTPTNFASWTAGFEAQETVLTEYLKTYRVYSRALTAEEVASNYKYELATIV